MARPKKRATRQLSDFIADFGVLPGPLEYEAYVGLVMNSSRARLRRVYFKGLAQTLAGGFGEVPDNLVEAACESQEEAKHLAFEINANRYRAKAGW